MRVFNVILNGEDAVAFCHSSVDFKIQWIIKNTNQQNMEIIKDYIENPPKNEYGCGCGGESKAVKQDKKTDPIATGKPSVEQQIHQIIDEESEQSNDEPDDPRTLSRIEKHRRDKN